MTEKAQAASGSEVKMTQEEILADLDVQLKQAQLAKARIELADTEEEIQRRQNAREERRRVQRNNAKVLSDRKEMLETRFLACNHKKGGTDANWRKGDNDKHCVADFQLPNGDWKRSCTKCGVEVVPPVEPLRVQTAEEVAEYMAEYGFRSMAEAGIYLRDDKAGYAAAMKDYRKGLNEYRAWLGLTTNNIAATSCLPTQTGGPYDWKRAYRVAVHQSFEIPLFAAHKYQETKRLAEAASSK